MVGVVIRAYNDKKGNIILTDGLLEKEEYILISDNVNPFQLYQLEPVNAPIFVDGDIVVPIDTIKVHNRNFKRIR